MSNIIKTHIPAIKGNQGPHLVTFATQVSPGDLIKLLGYDPRELVHPKKKSVVPRYTVEEHLHVQRKLIRPRFENICNYIRNRFGSEAKMIGAFPAISICFEKPVRFTSLNEAGAFVNLELDDPSENPRLLFDGFGRSVGSLHTFFEDKINLGTLPVTLYSPSESWGLLSRRDRGQMFHDFNAKAADVAGALVMRLDNSDIYLRMANQLGSQGIIASRGGIEEGAKKLGKRSTALLPQQLLNSFVRGACEGPKFQENSRAVKGHYRLTEETYEELFTTLEGMLKTLEAKMGASFVDRDRVHLSYMGFQAIGLIFNDLMSLKLESGPTQQVISKLAGVDWTRFNPDWVNVCHLGKMEPDSTGRPKLALGNTGRTSRFDLHMYLRDKTGLDLMCKHPREVPNAAE